MSAYRDSSSHRAEEIALQPILPCVASLPIGGKRNADQKKTEELIDLIFYWTRQMALREELQWH